MLAIHELCLHVLRWPADATLQTITIAPASVERIRERAPSLVTRSETLDFRTLTPERGGLFDYKVFGPGTVIDAPVIADDEPWKPRNTKFARLPLARPLVHPLVLLHAPGDIAEHAGMTRDELHRARFGDDVELRRTIVDRLEASEHGSALVLRELAVLPPDLRPLARLADDRWQSSSINDLYRRVIERNQRLARLLEQSAPTAIVENETALLHGALLALFDNELQDDPIRDPQQRPLISLRGLCGGNGGCVTALRHLDAAPPSQAPTARMHRVEAVTFALGFELRREGRA